MCIKMTENSLSPFNIVSTTFSAGLLPLQDSSENNLLTDSVANYVQPLQFLCRY